MKKICFFLILLGGVTHGHAQVQKFITSRGTRLVTPAGKTYQMKGTNLGNWLVPEGYMFKFKNASSPRLIQGMLNELVGQEKADDFWKKYLDNYITREDIHYLATLGMNSLRIPFHYKLFTNEAYLGGSGAKRGFALMDKLVAWCREEKLYLLLDMHCAPGGQTGDNIDDSWGTPFLFEETASQQQTIAIWKMIATHYKDEPYILGYDLLNEPIATYFDSSRYNKHLEPLYKKITQAIRSVDANHLIFYGGAQWNSNFRVFGKPFDSKAVYSFHKYWTPATTAVIQDYLDFGKKYQVPLHCGETGENTDEWVEQFRKVLDSNNVGWHYWPYKKMDNTRGIVSFTVPQYFEQVIGFADTARNNFELVRKSRPKNEQEISQALDGFLLNCRFKNCYPNKRYISALDFGKH
ncbi:MAG: cellulase family glycosylhydrolase [Ferruginibacter sp.]|nr:cellulase family glycosylhydrolase [Ferruginibacter sp.]